MTAINVRTDEFADSWRHIDDIRRATNTSAESERFSIRMKQQILMTKGAELNCKKQGIVYCSLWKRFLLCIHIQFVLSKSRTFWHYEIYR